MSFPTDSGPGWAPRTATAAHQRHRSYPAIPLWQQHEPRSAATHMMNWQQMAVEGGVSHAGWNRLHLGDTAQAPLFPASAGNGAPLPGPDDDYFGRRLGVALPIGAGTVAQLGQPVHHRYLPVDAWPGTSPHYFHNATMALPGHSPSSAFNGPGSPPRHLNGYPDTSSTSNMYGPHSRPMPPPSPQHFPRYSTQPPPPNTTHLTYANPQAPHKRPGSSMSISSMLGSEPEKHQQESYYHQRSSSSHGQSMPPNAGSVTSLGAIMSPPSYPPKSNPTEYSYKPRSTTPDRLGDYNQNRYRSGSGSMMQRPSPFTEISSAIDRQQPRYSETTQFGPQMPQRDEATERARRTSISGILQRPESAPQRPTMNGNPIPPNPLPRPESATPSMNGDPFSAPKAPSDRPGPLGGSYDTRPPPFSNRPPTAQPISFKEVRPFEKRDSQSSSPELRRVQPNGAERSFGSILNDGLGSQGMARQDSQLSQSSAFGGRYGPRAFSPFAPSVASQSMSVTSGPAEEQVRKGSDELSHRAILGLATESRRGRYSPVPQAVQGAQAQTPVPETGIKTEQGRVFAGLGGGLGASSTGPTSTPGGLSSSPLKDGTTRLSEENLMKMSRSTSGMGKRARKFDDELRAESDVGGAGKKGRKRSKYAHSYKIDLEDNARRGTPLSNSIQRTDSPLNVTSQPTQLSHHHHMPRQTDQRLLYKPKKTIRISSILTAAKRMPRKHLGTFKYDPAVSNPVTTKLGADKFDVSVRPNALPSFDGPDHVNCTYSIRVPKLWLQERERRMICRENFLWGSGIYTDDSDILAAAMHSGFIKSVPPEGVDRSLLDEIAKAQNTKIEGLVDPPEKPLVPEQDKDAVVTCVVLPSLEQYAGSARYGITSREWPDEKKGSVHDGVSFAVLKVEFVAGGVEARRMGRTGKERRERLRKELDDRKKGQERMKEMIEQMKSRMRRLGKVQRRTNGEHVRKELAGKAAMGSFKEKIRVEEQRQQQQKEKEKEQTLHASLDVGQAPGEWLQQLETSAVDA